MTKIRFYSAAMTFFALCMVAFSSKTMAQSFPFTYKGLTFTCTPISHPSLGSDLVEIHCSNGSGVCEIPETVTNGGTTYTVIGTKDNSPFSSGFTEVIIPNTVVYIGQQSFSGTSGATSLQKITFGENVKQISSGAFRWCTNLQEMRFKSDYRPRLVTHYDVSQPLLSDLRYAFGELIEGYWVRMVPASCVIVVPVGKISEYATLDVCNGTIRKFGDYFTNIIEFSPEITTVSVIVTEPIIGGNPENATTNTTNTTIFITEWVRVSDDYIMQSTDQFAAGQSYRCGIIIYPGSDYGFSTDATVTINGTVAGITMQATNYINCFRVFTTAPPISEVSATVTAPVGGANPDFTATIATEDVDKYTVVLSAWEGNVEERNLTTADKFVAGQEYVVWLDFAPKAGYEFSATPTATINGILAEFQDVYEGIAYFILRFIATDPSSINEVLANSISIYPNPTKGEIRIESGELRVEKVEILDITGRIVLTSHETTLNISQLSAGTYFVKLKTDKGELTKKVIKE